MGRVTLFIKNVFAWKVLNIEKQRGGDEEEKRREEKDEESEEKKGEKGGAREAYHKWH
jgi:ribosomal 50S subunit-recycling heat shock protein